MVLSFRNAVGPDAERRAAARGRTLREVVALAALVEKETARAEERPLVAGVYAARLRRGMLLQADPTVIYGLVLEGRYRGDLTRAHLREPGAYNTYMRPGLPPGPIANPGKAALDAAFDPAETDYLYFVSRNDGTHAFSRTLAGAQPWASTCTSVRTGASCGSGPEGEGSASQVRRAVRKAGGSAPRRDRRRERADHRTAGQGRWSPGHARRATRPAANGVRRWGAARGRREA